jgi:beta-glucosidase
VTDRNTQTFPPEFLWGTIQTAHAVEGGHFHSDWWRWEQRPGRIAFDETSQTAADHFMQYEGDFDRAAWMGLGMHGLGVEWSRVEPEPNRFDEEALEHYVAMAQALTDRDIEPLVVLHHGTLPAWLADRDGWHGPEAVEAFMRYAKRVAATLAPHTCRWLPLAEPMQQVSLSYLTGQWPPQQPGPLRAFRALRNLARSHAAAYRAIREVRDDAEVGFGMRARHLTPHDSDTAWDLRMAHRESRRSNRLLLDLLTEGRWPRPMRAEMDLAGCVDFIVAAYGGAERIRFSTRHPRSLFAQTVDANGKPRMPGEGDPDPEGLRGLLSALGVYDLPVFVSCGVATEDDGERRRYLLDHIAVLQEARESGVDVRGLLYRSLLDGFEWTRGYTARYGLVHVDRASLARTPNESAYMYKAIIEAGSISPGIAAKHCPNWRPANER